MVLEPSGGATANPRYFHLRDRARGLEISGWIEPARTYKGFDEFWDAETLARVKGGIAPPASWSVTKVERWEAALYDFGSSPASGNVRAEWVEDGSWIDLHISVASAQPIEAKRAAALEVLKAIGVRKSRSIGN